MDELSPEELRELERELEMDFEDGEGDSDGEGWDELESKLKSALHESEQAASSDLTNLEGFEQFRRTSTAMDEQIEQFSRNLTEVKEQSKSSAVGGVGGLEEKKEEGGTAGLTPADETKLLSMADIFELAVGAATRGAVSYCVSEVEARHSRQEEEEKRDQLEKIRKEKCAKELEIQRQNDLRKLQEEARAKAREEAREKRRREEEEHKEETKRRMEEMERAAHEEVEANRRALEEKRRKNKEKRVAIMEAEEQRWTLASKAVGFVQSRLRGLLGRKAAGKKKAELEAARRSRFESGAMIVFSASYRAASRKAFRTWRDLVRARVDAELFAALKIQSCARRRKGLLMVATLRQALHEAAAATKLQSRGRAMLAKRMVGEMKTLKQLEEEQRLAREEAAKKFREEQRKKEEEERRQRAERKMQEDEERALAEFRAKEERTARGLEELAKSRRDAERIIDANLFGSTMKKPVSTTTAVLNEREARREGAIEALKRIIDGYADISLLRAGPDGDSPDDDDTDHDAEEVQGEGQQIEEEMLDGLGAYSSLSSLKLDVEHIEDASNLEKFGVTSLTSLSLNVNKLKSLRTIGSLKKLERLSLRDNKVVSLKGMKQMQSLVELLVDVNSLTSLRTLATSCWFNLTTFSANTNRIACLPQRLSSHLPSLCVLNLYQNNISEVGLKTFENLPSLTSLDLGRNRLTDAEQLGVSLSLAPTLRKLILSQNSLLSPPALTLPLLQQLWLSSNKISTMKAWGMDSRAYMPCLLELYLQENSIGGLGGIGAISHAAPLLDKLDLSFNCIDSTADLALALRCCDDLKTLDVQDNPVTAATGWVEASDVLLRTLPKLKALNGVTVGDDARWAATTRALKVSAAGVIPVLKGFLSNCIAAVPLKEGCEGASETLRGEFAESSACSSCGFVGKAAGSAVAGAGVPRQEGRCCSRCGEGLYTAPAPMCYDWQELAKAEKSSGSAAAAEARMKSWSEACKKVNREAAKSRSSWRKRLASDSRSVRQEAMVDHAELLKSHLAVLVGDSEAWMWELTFSPGAVMSRGKGGVASSGTLKRHRKLSTVISVAAALRIQCFIRRFLATQRTGDLRSVKARHSAAARIQGVYRGRKVRGKLEKVKGMTFDYVDGELEELLRGDEDLDGLMAGLDGGWEEEMVVEEAWEPTKPQPSKQDPGPPPTLETADAWRTPVGTPAVSTRGGEGGGGVSRGSLNSREVSSPFGGVRGSTHQDPVALRNLRDNGFDFVPPTSFQNVPRDADDISVRSINTTASSIPGGGSGGGGDLTARSSSSRAAKAEQKKQSVMEDWGFKDAKVAQLMMKRAKRMNKGKKASARKEKMKDAMYR
eukprot:CAMPEP_0197568836 /NCGR_PEP_ID=MMETSP1320-20131121/37969_1 /TAXON_ID=91990 /ORGANISM="Bolidomonas sp., Strain RCC2347" /LENGTH=1342 /DNA_ID=CAMNT_0043131133 /DNA_START=89 /DNA_END=4114 /DNA_ORIENTATION=-